MQRLSLKAVHYRKITEEDVFTVIIHIALDPFQHTEGVISAPNIADFLGTSVYQVRKHISELVKKNLVERAAGYICSNEEICPPVNGYSITEKAAETKLYAKLYEEHEKGMREWAEGFPGEQTKKGPVL